MEIGQIKQQLSILKVLSVYGLIPNKNHHINCPFHDDKTPSMQVYPKTNTVHCFSGNCKHTGKAMDVIDFIMYKEGINKHQAILKAKAMLGESAEKIATSPKPKDLASIFKELQSQLVRSGKAKKYLQSRGLDQLQEIGSNHRSNGHYIYEHLKDCLVFPLKNRVGETVSFYGRSFVEIRQGKGHYYLSDRSGFYPEYPSNKTKKLILCESVIDAATLLLHGKLSEETSVLACYGTNGLSEEHKEAITELSDLQEVILFFDGDEAGKKATAKWSKELEKLNKELLIKTVSTPNGYDLNDLWVNHEDSEILQTLIAESKPVNQSKEETKSKYQYEGKYLGFNIKGAIKHLGDGLKLTLQSIDKQSGKGLIQKLDLYDFVGLEKHGKTASKYLGINVEYIVSDWQDLVIKLEQDKDAKERKKEEPIYKMSKASMSRCIEFLKSPNLLVRINAAIGKTGVVGEEKNRLLLFLIASSYKRKAPLNGLIEGSSGSGKTKLLQSIYNLIPPEDRKTFTRMTESSFYNFGQKSLCNKLLCFEDIDGLKEEALLALRELMSNGQLISGVAQKQETGLADTVERVVDGPIASISCTTRGDYYEDNINRCFVVSVDESAEQTNQIIKHQNKLAKGLINMEQVKITRLFVNNCLRLFKLYEVVNPYADSICLPEGVMKKRRLHQMYHLLVSQITYLHQYQRKQDGQGRLISEKSDLLEAAKILLNSIVLKVDELEGSLRQFYESLKEGFKDKGEDYNFNRFEVKALTGLGKTQIHYYLRQLVELEYLQQYGHSNRGYKYRIAQWDQYDAMRLKVEQDLLSQISKL